MTVAHPFDVAARLAEGRPAVDDVSEYVLACSRLGFQHQDLTTQPAQVRGWYGSEDGLDLRALDTDCTVLAAAAVAAEDAARRHVALAAELSGAWSGRGATAAGEFAIRSGHAATTVSSAVRGAADALAALREELWRAVDAKVAAVQAIDGRHVTQRAQWLAAAHTVTTGGGDLASASELVDQQVKPFVANDIASEWLGAMRAAAAAIGGAYDTAIARASVGAPAVFDVPGALGPRAESRARPPSNGDGREATGPSPAATSVPATGASFSSGPGPGAGSSWGTPAVTPPTPAEVPPAAMRPAVTSPAAMPAVEPTAGAPSVGDLGGAAPGLGSGVSGFGQQLADLIGGLIGSFGGTDDLTGADGAPDGSVGDPAAGDDNPDDLEDADDSEGADDPGDTDGTDGTDDDPEETDPAESESVEDAVGEPVEPAVDPAVDPVAPEPTTPPPPPPDPSLGVPAEQTACEIAADELPQVGE